MHFPMLQIPLSKKCRSSLIKRFLTVFNLTIFNFTIEFFSQKLQFNYFDIEKEMLFYKFFQGFPQYHLVIPQKSHTFRGIK